MTLLVLLDFTAANVSFKLKRLSLALFKGLLFSSIEDSNSPIVPWNPSLNQEPFSWGMDCPLLVKSLTFCLPKSGPTLIIVPLVPVTIVLSCGPNFVKPSKTREACPLSNWIKHWDKSGGLTFWVTALFCDANTLKILLPATLDKKSNQWIPKS